MRFNATTGAVTGLRLQWFDATRTVYQDCSTGVCRVVLSDGTELAVANAPTIAGEGGTAAWENSLDMTVHDSAKRSWPLAGLHQDCSPDGAYALKVLRNSYGPWDVIEQDGSRWRLTDGDAHDIQLLGNRQAIWMIGVDDYHTAGLPVTVPSEHHYGLRAAWAAPASRFITLYQRVSDGALVCDGHVVAPPSDKYFYADIDFRDNLIHIGWSPNQADADVQLMQPFTLEQLATLPVSPAPPVPLTLPAPARPLWTGWFEFSGPWKSPGNVTLDVHDSTKIYAKAGLLGRFISGDTVEDIEKAAGDSQERPIVYWDNRVWPRLPNVPEGSWTCLQAYCRVDETPTQFKASLEQQIVQMGNRPVVLVCQQYTSNAGLTANVTGIAPVFCELANAHPNIRALLLFSGSGRATGLQDHPELLPAWSTWAQTLQTPDLPVYRPTVPPPPQPKPPAPKPDPIYVIQEVRMSDIEIVAVKGPKGKFARIDAAELGKGPFGWFPVHFDRDSADDDCHFELSKPDQRFLLQHVKTRALLGLDATLYSDDIPKQFYGKPDAPDARGAYESPIICYDPLNKSLIFGYIPYYDYGFVSSGFGIVKL